MATLVRVVWMLVVVNVLMVNGRDIGVVASPRRAVDPSLNARVTQAVQEVLDGQAAFWNTSFSASFVGSLKNTQGDEHQLCTLPCSCHMHCDRCLSIDPSSRQPCTPTPTPATLHTTQGASFTLDIQCLLSKPSNATVCVYLYDRLSCEHSCSIQLSEWSRQ